MGQDKEELHHKGTKDTKGEDRPDLELERLVMGDRADGVRPAQGWLVREDVVRGAVERITSAQYRAKQHAEDMQLAIARQNAALSERDAARVQKLDADKVVEELREQVEALNFEVAQLRCERNDGLDRAKLYAKDADMMHRQRDEKRARVKELEEQVEALTAQLEEEERMVARLREDVLGAPRGTVKVEEVQRYVGSRRIVASVPEDWPEETKVALVRLTPDGLGLAGDVDKMDLVDVVDGVDQEGSTDNTEGRDV